MLPSPEEAAWYPPKRDIGIFAFLHAFRYTPYKGFPYGVPFGVLFEHDIGIFAFLHAFQYTPYEAFPYDVPFGVLFEHDWNIFLILHVYRV